MTQWRQIVTDCTLFDLHALRRVVEAIEIKIDYYLKHAEFSLPHYRWTFEFSLHVAMIVLFP